MKLSVKLLAVGLLISSTLVGCASARFKQRQQLREKEAAASGLFCEFVSGDEFPDVDVEVSLRMAKRCDSAKAFSVTSYRNSSEQFGLTYCCAMRSGGAAAQAEQELAIPLKEEKNKSEKK